MNKTDRAIRYFREGYSCSQAVLMACAGESGEAARMAAAFGGGMGRMQKTCGAVTGAYIWFGLAYGPGLPDEDDKARVYDRVREFNRIFTVERNGTDQCSELLGQTSTPVREKNVSARRGLTEKVCEKCIRDSVEIIESLE
jgi:C_GCAxxG_C_C family probable redox protein